MTKTFNLRKNPFLILALNSLSLAAHAAVFIVDSTADAMEANAGANTDGLTIATGDTTVSGLIINRFPGDGVFINGGDDNLISGNLIGTARF